MTANAMAGDREKAIDAGMDDHVAKPIDVKQLFNCLGQWIKPDPERIAETPEQTPEVPQAPLSGQSALPQTIKGINLKEGLMRIGGNEKLYRKLLMKLRDDYAGAGQEIKTLLNSDKGAEAELLAHSIKGVAGNVGAGSLQEAAAALESAIKKGETDRYEEKISFFGRVLSDVVTALKILGEEPEQTDIGMAVAGEADPQILYAALEEMMPYLKTRKPKQCKAAMDKIKTIPWPTDVSMEMADMERFIKKYKFKDALPLAESLQSKLKG